VTPDVSIVIPTFNRRTQLERTIRGLARQVDGTDDLEVIVVSDGSTDGTDEWLESAATPLPIVSCRQPNAGPAAARNRGVSAASAPLVLFLDDDVVPTPDLVAAHIRHHEHLDDDLVVIGPMRTPADFELSPWVRWEQLMLYKQYDAMERGAWAATPRQFYTANASLARRHLDASGGFDPTFRRAEDVELAYRLGDAGLRFTYAEDAVVLHYAERSFDSWRANASAYGRNDVIFGRDLGHDWLLPSIGREFHDRHALVRTLTRASLRSPRLGRLINGAATSAARTACVTGPDRLADAMLSVLYNLEYYRGMADELGDPRKLQTLFDDSVGPQ
jgi:GT2 family glycosyltransferase